MSKTHPYGGFIVINLQIFILNITSILNEAMDCETQYLMLFIYPFLFHKLFVFKISQHKSTIFLYAKNEMYNFILFFIPLPFNLVYKKDGKTFHT